jgi:WD40 repeat protein
MGPVPSRRLATGLVLACVVAAAVGGGPRMPPPPPVTRSASLRGVNSPGGFVDALALAPDARLVATGERGGQIRIWANTGEPAPVSLDDYRQAVADLAFSPDGGLLASLGRHRESAVRLWRPDHRGGRWSEAASLPVGRCLGLRFDGHGIRLAVLCETEVLMVDGASARAISRVPNPHRAPLTAFDLSADGRRLVVAGHDGEVAVLDALTGAPVRSFSVRQSRRPGPLPRGLEPPEVWAVVVALSGDGSRAAAVTIEGTVYVWDVTTGALLFDHADRDAGGPPPGSLRFGRDGTVLAPLGDRYGLRHIHVAAKASRPLTSAPNAYATVATTDDAAAFAAITSGMTGGRLTYSVEVWRIGAAPTSSPPRS